MHLPVDPTGSDTELRSGSGRLRLGRLGRGGKPPARGIKPVVTHTNNVRRRVAKPLITATSSQGRSPGSVVAGLKPVAAEFSGARGLKEGLVEEGSRGTVGKPGGEGQHGGIED